MDVRDFRVMTQRHAPWLLNWVASRTGQFRLRTETTKFFEALIAPKVKAIIEKPWQTLDINENPSPQIKGSSYGDIFIRHYYTVIWRKNDEDTVQHTGAVDLADLNVDKLLMRMFDDCQQNDTLWVMAVVKTVYEINKTRLLEPKHTFVIYPCEERNFMSWVDQHKESINQTLAQRQLTLSSYSVVALR